MQEKNYITFYGYRCLQAELRNLIEHERPQVTEAVHWAAKNGDRSENGDYIYGKQRLRQIDRRIRFLTQRLECAERVDFSGHAGSDQIFFGACVGYEEVDVQTQEWQEREIRIVGVDETTLHAGAACVSWVSPIARLMLKARVGDVLRLRSPTGDKQIEIVSVRYPQTP